MIDVNYKTEGEKLTLFIEGRIDSANAPDPRVDTLVF